MVNKMKQYAKLTNRWSIVTECDHSPSEEEWSSIIKVFDEVDKKSTFVRACWNCSYERIEYCGNSQSSNFQKKINREDLCNLWKRADWIYGTEVPKNNN